MRLKVFVTDPKYRVPTQWQMFRPPQRSLSLSKPENMYPQLALFSYLEMLSEINIKMLKMTLVCLKNLGNASTYENQYTVNKLTELAQFAISPNKRKISVKNVAIHTISHKKPQHKLYPSTDNYVRPRI